MNFTRDYNCLFVELHDIWAYITLNPYRIVSGVEPMQILHEYDICLRISLKFN